MHHLAAGASRAGLASGCELPQGSVDCVPGEARVSRSHLSELLVIVQPTLRGEAAIGLNNQGLVAQKLI